MKKDELMQVIEILKEYDLINVFNSAEEASEWLLSLDSKKINNLKKLHKNESILNSSLRKSLLNEKLLASDFYEQIILAFLKLENRAFRPNKAFDELCDEITLDEKAVREIEKISTMDDPNLGVGLLEDEDFINSPYHDEDLELICSSEAESDLYDVATSVESINSKYHLEDMKLISKNFGGLASLLASLATNQDSLESETHLDDMKLLESCPIEFQQTLYELMSEEYIINDPNYELFKKSIIKSTSFRHASAKSIFINDMISSIEEPEKLEYLLNSIDSMDDKIVFDYVDLFKKDSFFNSPYLIEDVELLKSVKDVHKFGQFKSLVSRRESAQSEHHVQDAISILEEPEDWKSGLLLRLAENVYSLNSKVHRFDMNFVKGMTSNDEDVEYLDILEHYLFDEEGINASDHVDVLHKISEGWNMEIKTPVEEYFESLISNVQSEEDGKDINMLIKK